MSGSTQPTFQDSQGNQYYQDETGRLVPVQSDSSGFGLLSSVYGRTSAQTAAALEAQTKAQKLAAAKLPAQQAMPEIAARANERYAQMMAQSGQRLQGAQSAVAAQPSGYPGLAAVIAQGGARGPYGQMMASPYGQTMAFNPYGVAAPGFGMSFGQPAPAVPAAPAAEAGK